MRIKAISPMGHLPNPPRQNRATLSVRYDSHVVKDWDTGEEHALDPVSAWNKIKQLNGWVA